MPRSGSEFAMEGLGVLIDKRRHAYACLLSSSLILSLFYNSLVSRMSVINFTLTIKFTMSNNGLLGIFSRKSI